LRGADIVILPDHDAPGYAHAEAIASVSFGIAKRIRILKLAEHWSGCPEGGDVSDFFNAGYSREQLDWLIEQAPDYRPQDSKPDVPKQQTAQTGNLATLKTMTFAPIKTVVSGLIVEGLTVLAGKPKGGKSWMFLHIGIAVARGGFTLGDKHCIEGDVLYCALEDNERRLQSRATKLLGIADWPARFSYRCELPQLAAGGIKVIEDWIEAQPNPRLVIIDTLAMVRAPKQRDESNYDSDYAAVRQLRELANKKGVAIVLIHHLRKADADDAFDTVSGTLGLTGAADSVLVLKRDTSGTVILYGHGRDLEEIETAMAFDRETCLWRVVGDPADVRRSTERAAVLKAIEEAGEPISPKDIADATGMRDTNVRFLLGRLVKEGAIDKTEYGKYRRWFKPAAEGEL
jgi:hypothetical protein